MHILSIGNDKRLQATALDKCPQFLKNLDIFERGLNLNKGFPFIRHLIFKTDKQLSTFGGIFLNKNLCLIIS